MREREATSIATRGRYRTNEVDPASGKRALRLRRVAPGGFLHHYRVRVRVRARSRVRTGTLPLVLTLTLILTLHPPPHLPFDMRESATSILLPAVRGEGRI